MRRAPLIIVPHSNQRVYLDRYAEPDKGWTDRDEARWPVPYWHIDTGFASLLMLLDRGRRGPGRVLLRHPAGADRTPTGTAFGVPAEFTPIGAIDVGYRAPDRRSPSLEAGPPAGRRRWCTADAGA